MPSSFNGRLTTSSPMYCHSYSCDSTDYYYESVVISVDKIGSFSFRSQSDFDAYGCIYNNSFDPSYPYNNLLVQNDDGGEGLEFNVVVVLQPQSTYILVVSTYSSHVTGSFLIIASGPTSVSFVHALNLSTMLTTSTTVKINSKYFMYSPVVTL